MAAKAFMDVVAIFVLVFAIMSPYVETQPEAPPPSLSDGNFTSFLLFLYHFFAP